MRDRNNVKRVIERRASSEGEGSYDTQRISRTVGNKEKINSVFLATNEVEHEKSNEKHLKIIEDQMIQSKQAERALKRREGDVKKEQRQVRQAVAQFDAS